MNVAGLAANTLLTLNSLLRSGGSSAGDAFAPTQDQANSTDQSARGLSILPTSGAMPLSFANILALQKIDEPGTTSIAEVSNEQKFLEEARKSPMQRMREQVLDELGLSEEALAQMTPDERRAAEEKIRQMIEEKIRQAMGADDAPADSNAAMVQRFA